MSKTHRLRAWQRNRRTMSGLGIAEVAWVENRGACAIYRLTMIDREEIYVQVPVFGSTETTVLTKAAEILKDQPVRYA